MAHTRRMKLNCSMDLVLINILNNNKETVKIQQNSRKKNHIEFPGKIDKKQIAKFIETI